MFMLNKISESESESESESTAHYLRGIAAYTPQISCHLCDLVCFGVQFP